MVAVVGHPGSGQTTFARCVSSRMEWKGPIDIGYPRHHTEDDERIGTHARTTCRPHNDVQQQQTISRVAEACGARLMGVATEPGILEELRTRLQEGKGRVAMPQARESVD